MTLSETSHKNIRFAVDGHVATITIDRPPLNVLNIETMREMNEAIRSAGAAAGVRVLVITSAGEKAFSAGVDVLEHTGEKVSEMIDVFGQIFFLLADSDAVTVAAVKGAALGGGCEVAMACDLIFASDTLKIGQPEIKLAVIAPVACAYLPRLIGLARANELLLSGDTIGAEEALRIGLVNKVVPAGDFERELDAFVGRFASNSGVGIKYTKRAMRSGLSTAYPGSLKEINRIYLEELMKTEDANEGLKAFLEKRKPSFRDL
jgi:cyclohexa-1,5-dienecarbonyl-CoA hydratase